MTFDALVIGGGPAGCASAIRLAKLGHSVAIAEGRPHRFKIGESLPPSVKPILAELDLLHACEGALTSFGNQSAWGSARLEDTDFIRDPHGTGFHVDRLCFERRLRSIAAQRGAVMLEPLRVGAVTRTGGQWLLSTAAGRELAARFVFDCSGRNAIFAHSQGVRRTHFDRLVAIAAMFHQPKSSQDRDSRTLVESAESGWWYTSLVPALRRVVVFHTDPATPAFRRARTVQGFLDSMHETRHVHRRIAGHGYRICATLRVFSANSSRLDNVCGDGWIAAGDAAAAFDPLSSQGILTALYTGLHAAEAAHAMLDGIPEAAEAYRQIVGDVFQAYLENRNRYYGMEGRWPTDIFWNSRLLFGRADYIIQHTRKDAENGHSQHRERVGTVGP